MSKIKAIAFDFDGTISDSFEVFVHAVEFALRRKVPFSAQEINDLRQHSMREVIKILGIKRWQLPLFVVRGMREIDRHTDDLTIFDGMAEALKDLRGSGYKLYIVSSHSKKGIDSFLGRYELTDYFEHIYANVGLFGKPKNLRKLQREYGLAPNECVFVGDEVRDIEAARRTTTKCIAVTWGFNTADSLQAHNPDQVVHKPRELIDALRDLA